MFLLVLIYISVGFIKAEHNGLYLANTTKKTNDFSAAWLISRTRLVDTEDRIMGAVSMASATFSVLRNRCRNCKTLVSRDFLDYMVEHLSSLGNQIPKYDQEILDMSNKRLEQYVSEIKTNAALIETDSRLGQTIGLLIYSSNSFSKPTVQNQRAVRPTFFQATFWALFRYIKDIVVYVADQQDADIVDSMQLPYMLLTKLTVGLDHKNRTHLLPRDSILHLITKLNSDDPMFAKFNYVYYSEGDQILHVRDVGVIYDAIDQSNGTFVAVPHRMQTLTLKQDFPLSMQSTWGASHAQDIPSVKVVSEDVHRSRGSCCSSGDVTVAKCKGWWYQCINYGLKNFTTWLKFGEFGYTFPPATEHMATCTYSSEWRRCEVPSECMHSIPIASNSKKGLRARDVCNEIQHTVHLGPLPIVEIANASTAGLNPTNNKKDSVATSASAGDNINIVSPKEKQKAELLELYNTRKRTNEKKKNKRRERALDLRSGNSEV